MMFASGKKVFVNLRDLIFIGNLPNYVISEMNPNGNVKELEQFTSKESIDYLRNRSEIIDYDYLKNLSEEAIYDYIHSLYEEYFDLYKKGKGVYLERKMEICEYKVNELKKYIDYKKIYDKKYNKVKLLQKK